MLSVSDRPTYEAKEGRCVVAEGFKIADAFVEVHTEDNTKGGLSSILRGITGIMDRSSGGAMSVVALSAKTAVLGAVTHATAGTVAGLVATVSSLAGAGLALPGILAGGAVAMGTMALATQGFSDALTGSEKAQKKAYAAMGPEAKRLVDTLKGMGSAAQDFQNSVQDTAVKGLSEDVKSLGGLYLPILKAGLGGVATEMNATVRAAAGGLLQPRSVLATQVIIDQTEISLGRMRGSLNNVITGLLGVGQVGSTYLPGIAGWVDQLTLKFRNWVTAGMTNGGIKRIIDEALIVFTQLGGVASNVGGILSTVWESSNINGGGFLNTLLQISGAILAVVTSVQGQEALGTFFSTLATLAGLVGQAIMALIPILPQVSALFGALAISVATSLLPAIQFLVPILGSVLGFLTGMAPVLGPIIIGIIAMAGVVKLLTAGLAVYNAISGAVRAATLAWAGVQWVLNAALSANPIGIVIAIIAGLVAAIVVAYNTSSTFRNIVQGAWRGVQSAISSAVSAIKGTIAWFGGLGAMFSGWFNSARAAVANALSGIVGNARNLPGLLLSVFAILPNLLVNSGRGMIEGLWRGIQGAIGWVKGMIGGALQSIRNLFPFSPAKEGPFSGSGYTTHSGKALARDFAGGILSELPGIRSAADAAMRAANMGMNAPTLSPSGNSLIASGTISGRSNSQVVNIHMTQPPGSPAEAARLTALALRSA